MSHLASWRIAAAISIGVSLAATARARAQDAPEPAQPAAVTLPDTDAGKLMAWYVESIGSVTAEDGAKFHPEFLKQVPAAQLPIISQSLLKGPFKGGPLRVAHVEPGEDPLHCEAILTGPDGADFLRAIIHLDAETKLIVGFLFVPGADPSLPAAATLDELSVSFSELPGAASFGVFALGAGAPEVVAAYEGSRSLAVGSTFKLYVLHALTRRIEAASLAWDTPVAINPKWKSLPSGRMQLEPDGKEYPVRHYAEQMISISDNTATDHLLFNVGRSEAEASLTQFNASPERTIPFLSTREMFSLKLGGDAALRDRFAAASAKERAELLGEEGAVTRLAPNLLLASAWTKPVEIDRIEWFASAADCAAVMNALRLQSEKPGLEPTLEVLAINPGVRIDRTVFPYAGFKGGSEPGVINLTHLLRRADGRWFVVSSGWNNTSDLVSESRLVSLHERAIRLTGELP